MKLVAISENGDRQFDLLTTTTARETHPAVSPDGAWIVFASTRASTDRTSLWIAKLGVEVEPTRLTDGVLDTHPVWTRDGKAIVFASMRDGNFDLYQVAREGGAPAQLTNGEHHEVTPTIAPDGAIIYAAVDKATGASKLEERAPDGTITELTPGPDEREPAISPDGSTIAFTSKVQRDDRNDSELWFTRRGPWQGAKKDAQQLVNLPPTDESGAVWSRDGRYVFATSTLPGSDNRPLFASIIFVDRHESPMRVRILRDSAGALVRLTPAIATATLDAPTLRRVPEYLPELAKVIAAAIAKQRTGAPQP